MTAHGEGLPYQLGRLLQEGPLTRWQIRERTGWTREQADYAIARGVRMAVVRKDMVELLPSQVEGEDFYRMNGYVFSTGVRLDVPCECWKCRGSKEWRDA